MDAFSDFFLSPVGLIILSILTIICLVSLLGGALAIGYISGITMLVILISSTINYEERAKEYAEQQAKIKFEAAVEARIKELGFKP